MHSLAVVVAIVNSTSLLSELFLVKLLSTATCYYHSLRNKEEVSDSEILSRLLGREPHFQL